MSLRFVSCTPARSLDALAEAVDAAKGDDPLAGVTVIVPTNVSGVMARRALGRAGGVIGVDMVTLNRVGELIAGPMLAAARRQPVSAPVVELTIRAVLSEQPGRYAAVADHPSTIVSLRDLHEELRLAGPDAAEALRATSRGREAVRVSHAVTRALEPRWYDEADLLEGAQASLADAVPAPLRRVVAYLPTIDTARGRSLLRRIGEVAELTVVAPLTGDPLADRSTIELAAALGADPPTMDSEPAPVEPAAIVSTTDADDEVRQAVRRVVDAARGDLTGTPVPFERIAMLWPSHRPYARLVEHHLTADHIPWNGRAGTELTERLAPRLLLDLLDVDRGGLQRRRLFELLADIPARDRAGRPLPTATWERVSRAAGVSRDDDWGPRLRAIASNERWADAAKGLDGFVRELRRSLGPAGRRRPWRDWVEWSKEQLDQWLGRSAIARMSDPDYRAFESLTTALDRLQHLDAIGGPVDRHEFRAALESELRSGAVREGRIGTGVAVGSLAGAAGLDVDVAIVLGGAEGFLPPAPRADPLLSDADRDRAGLPTSDDRAHRLLQQLRSVVERAHTTVTVPRGDLRTTTAHQISRWLTASPTELSVVGSHTAALRSLAFPPSERERRWRDRWRTAATGRAADPGDDTVLERALALQQRRDADDVSVFDGDLTASEPPSLDARVVSATQIEAWAKCPYGYFLRYVLRVRTIDEPDSAITIGPLERGVLQHEALDRFHRRVIAGELPQPTHDGWTDEHRAAVLDEFDRACDAAEAAGRTGRPATWAGERRRMRADVVEWLRLDGDRARARGITVVASEFEFGTASLDPEEVGAPAVDAVALPLPDGRAVHFLGKVDRVDREASGTIVVTDHKTGKVDAYKGLSADDPTLGGTVFQLPTYAAAARQFVDPGATDDRSAVRAEYGMFGRGKYLRPGYRFTDEVWDEVVNQLGAIVDGIESGWFPQVPERPGFRLWVPCAYCEPDGLGTADAWARWVRKRRDERIAPWFGVDGGGDP